MCHRTNIIHHMHCGKRADGQACERQQSTSMEQGKENGVSHACSFYLLLLLLILPDRAVQLDLCHSSARRGAQRCMHCLQTHCDPPRPLELVQLEGCHSSHACLSVRLSACLCTEPHRSVNEHDRDEAEHARQCCVGLLTDPQQHMNAAPSTATELSHARFGHSHHRHS